mmetsp:Transcript_39651/g.98207  ORF Transcript_39651/g.98207 Transcript_39651/m.98207 type:complete len:134 (+) Transcript_39651:1676-2077(+)
MLGPLAWAWVPTLWEKTLATLVAHPSTSRRSATGKGRGVLLRSNSAQKLPAVSLANSLLLETFAVGWRERARASALSPDTTNRAFRHMHEDDQQAAARLFGMPFLEDHSVASETPVRLNSTALRASHERLLAR